LANAPGWKHYIGVSGGDRRANVEAEDRAAVISVARAGPPMSTEASPEFGLRSATYPVCAYANYAAFGRVGSRFFWFKEEIDAAVRPLLPAGALGHHALSAYARFQST